MSLNNKTLLGGWISTAAKVFRRDKSMGQRNLPGRFEECSYKACKIKKQTIYNCRNLYKLMSIAPKLMNCWVNMTYFVKNHEFFLIILKKMKKSYLGNITFIAHATLVSYTFLKIKRDKLLPMV